MTRPCSNLLALFLLALTVSVAGPLDAAVCGRVNQPSATLLYPYFEVDLSAPRGRTTVISINNADEQPTLAHVVLWTNWGIPTLAFDVFLEARDAQTLDLRRVLDGRLPTTTPPVIGDGSFPSCPRPLAIPQLSQIDMQSLWAKHTGQAWDWECASTPQEPSLSLAVGYVTVDVVNDCSETIRFPADTGYFVHGGQGLASNRNVLWGDMYFLDSDGNRAQGVEAVSIYADAERFGPDSSEPTFYVEEILGKDDNRAPLSHTYRSRYVNAGSFDGATEFILWHAGFCVPLGVLDCGGSPLPSGLRQELVMSFFNDRGEPVGEPQRQDLWLRMTRLNLSSAELPPEAITGHVEIRVDGSYEGFEPRAPAQAWLIPVLTASDRYSLSLNAVQIDGSCEP